MSAVFALALVGSGIGAKSQLAAAIVVHWTEVAGAVAYEVEIADDETFAEPAVKARAKGTSYRWDDVPKRRMYWRVRSIDVDARLGEWSESKEIAAVFVPPELQKPHAGTTFSLDESIRLEWSASKIFTSYHVTIASDASFAHVVVDKTVNEPHLQFQAADLGTYFWRVRAIDYAAKETAASPARQFIVNLAAPEWQEVTTSGRTLILSWRPARGALRYRVEVSDSTQSITSYTTQTELTLPVAHSGDVRVVAERGNKSAAAVARHFVVGENAVGIAPADKPPSSLPVDITLEEPPLWAKHFWIAPTLAFGDNLRNVIIYSPGLEFSGGWAIGTHGEVGFAVNTGVFYFSQTAGNRPVVQTQVWVVPTTLFVTGALTEGRWRSRAGVGLALNSSVAEVGVQGAAGFSDVRLSPGPALLLAGDIALGRGALLAELRWSYVPRFGTVRFESGGLTLAIGYAFYL